jgi:hypothetical protein
MYVVQKGNYCSLAEVKSTKSLTPGAGKFMEARLKSQVWTVDEFLWGFLQSGRWR